MQLQKTHRTDTGKNSLRFSKKRPCAFFQKKEDHRQQGTRHIANVSHTPIEQVVYCSGYLYHNPIEDVLGVAKDCATFLKANYPKEYEGLKCGTNSSLEWVFGKLCHKVNELGYQIGIDNGRTLIFKPYQEFNLKAYFLYVDYIDKIEPLPLRIAYANTLKHLNRFFISTLDLKTPLENHCDESYCHLVDELQDDWVEQQCKDEILADFKQANDCYDRFDEILGRLYTKDWQSILNDYEPKNEQHANLKHYLSKIAEVSIDRLQRCNDHYFDNEECSLSFGEAFRIYHVGTDMPFEKGIIDDLDRRCADFDINSIQIWHIYEKQKLVFESSVEDLRHITTFAKNLDELNKLLYTSYGN